MTTAAATPTDLKEAPKASGTAPTSGEQLEEKHFLTPSEIFDVADIAYESVYVEPWKGWVMMKVLSGEDMVKLTEIQNSESRKNGDLLLIMMCLVHPETKKPLMNFDQLDRMKKKSLHAFQILQEAAQRLNRLGKYAKNDLSGILG